MAYQNPNDVPLGGVGPGGYTRIGMPEGFTNMSTLDPKGEWLGPDGVPSGGYRYTQALVPWYNPRTGEYFVAHQGGYIAPPGSGWISHTGSNRGNIPEWTGVPDPNYTYEAPPLPQPEHGAFIPTLGGPQTPDEYLQEKVVPDTPEVPSAGVPAAPPALPLTGGGGSNAGVLGSVIFPPPVDTRAPAVLSAVNLTRPDAFLRETARIGRPEDKAEFERFKMMKLWHGLEDKYVYR